MFTLLKQLFKPKESKYLPDRFLSEIKDRGQSYKEYNCIIRDLGKKSVEEIEQFINGLCEKYNADITDMVWRQVNWGNIHFTENRVTEGNYSIRILKSHVIKGEEKDYSTLLTLLQPMGRHVKVIRSPGTFTAEELPDGQTQTYVNAEVTVIIDRGFDSIEYHEFNKYIFKFTYPVGNQTQLSLANVSLESVLKLATKTQEG